MNSRDDSLPRYHPCHLHWVKATGVPLGLGESYRCTFPQSYSSCRFVASTTVTNLIRSMSQTCRVPGHCNQPQSVSWTCGGLDHCNQPQSRSWTYRGHCNQPQSVCHGPFVATVTKLNVGGKGHSTVPTRNDFPTVPPSWRHPVDRPPSGG